MNWLNITLIYIAYHIANILIAKWNAVIVANRIKRGNPKQIEHGWYFIGYVVLCAPMYWFINIWFAGAVLCLHGSVFPVAYNLLRGITPFNLSKTSKSKYDRTLVRIGFKDMEIPDFAAEFVSALLFTISLFQA